MISFVVNLISLKSGEGGVIILLQVVKQKLLLMLLLLILFVPMLITAWFIVKLMYVANSITSKPKSRTHPIKNRCGF